MLVEVCVQNLEDALLAEREGADRIELCASLEAGGISPSAGLISRVVEQLHIPVHVLLRPRAGDFCYSPSEIDVLLEDIRLTIELGASGIVTGVLDPDQRIDRKSMERIRAASQGCHLTFHRAFDLVPEPFQALDELQALQVQTVLTSGQCKRAVEALDLLKELKARSKGITIMPGGGIRPDNILKFKDAGFKAIHFSSTETRTKQKDETSGIQFSISDLGGSARRILNPELLRKMIRSVK